MKKTAQLLILLAILMAAPATSWSETEQQKASRIWGGQLALLAEGLTMADMRTYDMKGCGRKMRTILPKAKTLREESQGLHRSRYYHVRMAATEMTLCATCGSVIDACARAAGHIRDGIAEISAK
ncbi:MAG: hypothetical protein HQL52_03760 [Magnetococcales bacterium]|nr:hypothetical protein [Magnetococcales bacterium]